MEEHILAIPLKIVESVTVTAFVSDCKVLLVV